MAASGLLYRESESQARGTLVAATGVRLCPRATENEAPEARVRFCASELSISGPFFRLIEAFVSTAFEGRCGRALNLGDKHAM